MSKGGRDVKENHFYQRYSYLIFSLWMVCFLFFSSSLPIKAATAQKEEKDGFQVIAENEDAILYLSERDALLRIESKHTGACYDTKVMNGTSGNVVTQENQKSDLILSYFNDLKTGALLTVSDYQMAIENAQVQSTLIENGVRITYTLKEDKLSIDILPKYVDKDKMLELVIKHLTESQKKDIFDKYYRLYNDYYVRTKDSGVTELTIKNIANLFYEIGEYTQEDLEADNLQYGWESSYNPIQIDIVIEYLLEKDDLIVRIPLSECRINDEEKRIHQIQVLPYLLSSTQEEDGYIVVPDGSGAVIEFNNGRTTTTNYTSRIYGSDVLLNTETYSPKTYQASMPVIGMKYEDYGILAIVEEGSALAQINTEISGKTDNYNKAYFSFYVCDLEKVSTTSESDIKVNKYTEGNYQGDLVIRYKMLGKEEAQYSEMAKVYQQYLIEKGMLTKKEEEKEAPLFIEILGSVLRRERFIGIPYDKNISLTTFDQAKNILEELQNTGIKRMQVQYDGWMNNGMEHSDLTSIKPEKVLGGKSDFLSLVQYTEEHDIGLYPFADLEGFYLDLTKITVNGPNSLIKKHGAKFLNGKYAQQPYVFEPMTFSIIDMACKYWISPNYLTTYIDGFLKQSNKLNYTGIGIKDLGNTIIADYNTKKSINRESAMQTAVQNLENISQNYNILLSYPNNYAFGYADYITDIPITSNQYNVFNYDIPFLQLVLDGCAEYSLEAINQEPEKKLEEFMLNCIETKTNPKFILMSETEDALKRTLQRELFTLNFDAWKEKIINFYAEYNEFYHKVAGAQIEKHEYINENLRKITYTNGVTVYVNYGSTLQKYENNTIEAMNYLVLEGR